MVTWISALTKTRHKISGALSRLFTRSDKPEDVPLEALEETLLLSDVSVSITTNLLSEFETAYKRLQVSRREKLREMLLLLLGAPARMDWQTEALPMTLLVVGVNGSGKTTTCAKLAHLLKKAGHRPLLGAADTFRAAGSDQLRIWADRLGVDVVTGLTGADAAAVAFDSVDAAMARKNDVLIIDTAGRMHTKEPLMKELGKVRQAIGKRLAGAPQATWIVLDATMGQNALQQAKLFHQAVPLTGVVLTKLDGSAKAGFVFSIQKELGIPVYYAGLGEEADDLVPFDPAGFVDGLLGLETAKT